MFRTQPTRELRRSPHWPELPFSDPRNRPTDSALNRERRSVVEAIGFPMTSKRLTTQNIPSHTHHTVQGARFARTHGVRFARTKEARFARASGPASLAHTECFAHLASFANTKRRTSFSRFGRLSSCLISGFGNLQTNKEIRRSMHLLVS